MGSGETPEEWEARLRSRSEELRRQHETARERDDEKGLLRVADELDRLADEYDELARLLDDTPAEHHPEALQREKVAPQLDQDTRERTGDVDPR